MTQPVDPRRWRALAVGQLAQFMALLGACGLMLVALLISIADLVRHRSQPTRAWRPTETQVYSR